MNERIRELVKQATTIEEHKWGVSYDNFNKEKFAELLVKECLDIALEVRGEPATDTHYVIGYDRACEKMISGIREHFGVE